MVVGADDETVGRYNAELLAMSVAVAKRRMGNKTADCIGFMSLVDMFNLDHYISGDTEMQQRIRLAALGETIAAQRTGAAELSRQMMARASGTDATALRARIDASDRGALQLYRGFSRFMAEDLACNRYTRQLSRAELKWLASRVAFEMMLRNDAYSNLVKLFFPNHVGLSIHAHDKAGPKFGIRLFGRDVRAVNRLSLVCAEMRSVDQLHVPTPWHNCIATVAGTTIIAKAKVVRDALARAEVVGVWADGGHAGTAGAFVLHPAPPPRSPPMNPHSPHFF